MRITAIETIVPDLPVSQPYVFVQVRTDAGLTGLGQTADVRTAAVVHDLAVQFLIGADPRRITALWHTMFDHVAYHGYAGAEMRAISAIDIALWDIAGQAAGLPIGALLGGSVHDSVPVYNTCGSYNGLSDEDRARQDPVGLAEELLAAGINGMKWSPFDTYAAASKGQYITTAQLAEGVAGIGKIAAVLGDRMEIMIDAHGLWSPGCAGQILRALDELPVRWLEDPVSSDNAAEWARLREKSTVPIAGGERLQTRYQLQRLLQAGGLDVVIADLTWSGGITEGRRIADLAEVYGVPLATHGNSGPVNLWAAAHVLTSVRNPCSAEIVRLHHEYFPRITEGVSLVDGGTLAAPTTPGLGLWLRDELPRLDWRETTA